MKVHTQTFGRGLVVTVSLSDLTESDKLDLLDQLCRELFTERRPEQPPMRQEWYEGAILNFEGLARFLREHRPDTGPLSPPSLG